MKVVTLCSGGLDSVTLAYYISKYHGWEQVLLFVTYGQKHAYKESVCSLTCAQQLGLRLVQARVTWVGANGMKSALTSPQLEIPTGSYTPESLAPMVVPNRNAVLANLAASLAVSLGYDGIALAIHTGDHVVYPDTTHTFAFVMERFLRVATGKPTFSVYTPWVDEAKASIVKLGARMNVPFEKTWSCYVGGNVHCGKCSTCIERREAFVTAGVQDLTVYSGKEETNAVSDH